MFVTFIIISSLVEFDHYRDTRAAILDPCIQGIFHFLDSLNLYNVHELNGLPCWYAILNKIILRKIAAFRKIFFEYEIDCKQKQYWIIEQFCLSVLALLLGTGLEPEQRNRKY